MFFQTLMNLLFVVFVNNEIDIANINNVFSPNRPTNIKRNGAFALREYKLQIANYLLYLSNSILTSNAFLAFPFLFVRLEDSD